jgi:arginine kinase
MENNQNNTKVSHQQLQAKKYIEENELEKVVSEMLNSLVHEKAKQPLVYMIKYLAGLLSEEERKQHGLVIPEPYPKGKPIVKYPNFEKSDSLLKKYLTKNLWSSIKYNKTKYGANIMNVIKLGESAPEDKIGCILTDGNCITTFSQLLSPLISDIHRFDTDSQADGVEQYRPLNEFTVNITQAGVGNFNNQDRICENIHVVRLIYNRNIQDVPFTSIMTSDRRQFVESAVTKAIGLLKDDKSLKEGKYLTYNENEEEVKRILREVNYDESYLKNAELNIAWPDNRGVYISNDKEIVILVNFTDHFEVRFNHINPIDFIKIYNDSQNLIREFERHLNFEFDKYYGYITTDPSLLGAGISIYTEIKLSQFSKNSEFMNILDALKFDGYSIEDGKLKTKANFKLSYQTDLEFLNDYYLKLSALINVESDKESIDSFQLGRFELDETHDPAIKTAYEKVYEEYKYKLASTGLNLNSLIKFYYEDPSSPFGVLFSDGSEYKTFTKFIREYIQLTQNFDLNEFDHIHKADEHKNFIPVKNTNDRLISTNVCLIRNLGDFPFATSRNCQIEKVEEFILKALESISMKNFNGKYIKMEDESINKIIQDNSLYIFHRDEIKKLGVHSTFPKNRGVIIFTQNNICAVVNDIDHLKFEINIKGDDLNEHFMQILKLSNEFSKHLKFSYDKRLGFITACPRFIGTGLIIKSVLKLTHLAKSEEKLNNILSKTDFAFKVVDPELGTVELTNKYTIGRSETDLLTNLVCAINDLVDQDVE